MMVSTISVLVVQSGEGGFLSLSFALLFHQCSNATDWATRKDRTGEREKVTPIDVAPQRHTHTQTGMCTADMMINGGNNWKINGLSIMG
uniref:Putative secreted protein n=1 Tax=Anopheles darlingi TaxID=43151 RepID=A0A2M4DM45_ANODA